MTWVLCAVVVGLALVGLWERRRRVAADRRLWEYIARSEAVDRVLITVYADGERVIGPLTLRELGTLVHYTHRDQLERSVVYLVDPPPPGTIEGTALPAPGVPRPDAPPFDITAVYMRP